MTDYPNKSGDGETQGAASPQSTANSSNERQASSLGDLQDKATQDFREIRQAAEAQAMTALDKSTEMATEKKNMIAEQLAGVASALEKVGEDMKGGETAMVGRYASDLGGSAKRLAESLKDRDMSEIVSMAEDFGRRQPVAFLGLAAIAGLAASRFVTASGSRNQRSSTIKRVGAGAETSANPMAGRETVREVTPSARPLPQAGRSTTGQSSSGQSTSGQPSGGQSSLGQSQTGQGTGAASAASQAGSQQRSPMGAGSSSQSGHGQPGSTGSQSGFGQSSAGSHSSAGQSSSGQQAPRPASGMEATGIGGSGLGTSRDRPASSADTPTLSPSGPNPNNQQAGRVQVGETAIGQSSASPAQPGQAARPSTSSPSTSSNEGRPHVQH